MKLIRHGQRGFEHPGIVDADGRRRDLSGVVRDYDASFFADEGPARLAGLDPASLPLVPEDVRWAAPIARPGKIVCIGLNYHDHAVESGMAVPSEPIIFFKAPHTVVGPRDAIRIPRRGTKTDWEVELALVIGREARYLDDHADVTPHIAGYCISHDVSERAFQLERGGQWVKGKSCDTFNPLGPCLVTPDEIDDVQNLEMFLDVNGRRMQAGNTRTMIFPAAHIVRYLSQFMTLEPGDLVNTGTPPGVGMGRKPPRYLKAGDVVELGITGLGHQRQVCEDSP